MRRWLTALALAGSLLGSMAAAPAAESLLGMPLTETAYAKPLKRTKPVTSPGLDLTGVDRPSNAKYPAVGPQNEDHSSGHQNRDCDVQPHPNCD